MSVGRTYTIKLIELCIGQALELLFRKRAQQQISFECPAFAALVHEAGDLGVSLFALSSGHPHRRIHTIERLAIRREVQPRPLGLGPGFWPGVGVVQVDNVGRKRQRVGVGQRGVRRGAGRPRCVVGGLGRAGRALVGVRRVGDVRFRGDAEAGASGGERGGKGGGPGESCGRCRRGADGQRTEQCVRCNSDRHGVPVLC